MRLLLLTNNLDVVNGISTFIYQQSKVLIEKYNYEIFIATSGGDNCERFSKLGVKIIDKRFFSFDQRSYFNFILSLLFCSYVIFKYKIDVINPQIHYAAAYSYFPSRISRRPFIQTVHSIFFTANRLKPFYGNEFLLINSSFEGVIKKNINKANCTLVRCPFDFEKKKLAKPNKLRIVSSGRLVKEKSFEVFLNAISKLKRNVREKAEFFIIGSGIYEGELIKLKNKLNIEVDFKGIINDIILFFEGTHIFVMSTGNRYEGLGLGIIQAALNKNLIIAPDYYSIKELLQNGEDGFLFSQGDSQELSSILENVIENYNEIKTLADHFYSKIRDEFSYDKNGEIFNSTYNSLVS